MITRTLICPICGTKLSIETDANGGVPGTFLLPRHAPPRGPNLCAGYRVSVTFALAKCDSCGVEMGDHPSGLCMNCFGRPKPSSPS
jgi:hypothetical protein